MKPNSRSRIVVLLTAALSVSALHGAPPAAASPTQRAASPLTSRATSPLAVAAGRTATKAVANPADPAAPSSAYAPPDARARARALDSADRALEGRARDLYTGDGDTFERPVAAFGPHGLQYLTYRRLHRGLPVYGGDVIVATDREGAAVTAVTTGQRTRLDDVETRPVVTAERARAIARALLGTVTEQTAPRLTVHAAGVRPRLTWETVVTGTSAGAPSALHVYVDAADGSIADRWDDVRHGVGHALYNGDPVYIDTSGPAGTYNLIDTTRSGVSCAGPDGRVLTGADDDWGDGTATSLETACVDALFGVQHEWDMLREWLGRNGIDGRGRGFPIRVGVNQTNATWSGTSVEIGHNVAGTKPLTSLDVVAHEFGHAIFQTTGAGGSGGGRETDALNESTGDIFGALTEHYVNHPPELDEADYLVGEEVDYNGQGPIRNMYDPAALGGTNCYTDQLPDQDPHNAAGVQNHWFYLLAEGSRVIGRPEQSPVCAGEGVGGMGIRKAGAIFLSALNLKTVPWTHAKARRATVQAALALYPGCAEARQVKDAWDAVGVPAASNEPGCPPETQDFTVNLAESTGMIDQGSSTTVALRTHTVGNNGQYVDLSADGVPTGATVTFSRPRISSEDDSTMTVTAGATTPPGTYTILARGTGTVSRTASYRLTVTPATPENDFSLTLDRDQISVDRGSTATLTLTTATTAGAPQQVALSAVGLPDHVSLTFNPAKITTGQSARVTIHPSNLGPFVGYPVTIRATGAARRTAALRLTVRDPRPDDFSVRLLYLKSTVEVGNSTSTVLMTTTTAGRRQRVTVSASGAPSGVTVTANPASIDTDSYSTIRFVTSRTAALGTYPITVTATGSVTRSATFTLTIVPRAIPAWQAYTSYAVGDLVTYGGATYRCVIGHVSQPGWEPPRTPTLWAAVRPAG
ncbi:M4 family metallopeptidase [Streptosporangium sp. NPDC051023]|uniref:M4 family metallopeptidase n=1 Tax=Streptosporangium sp. NPDC051023 TaxID=3155410 RepID=UPI00344B63D8